MSTGLEILVVEDEPAVARGLARALTATGYTPRVAETGRQALELAALRPIAAVLLDLGLPDLDGMGLLRAIKEVRPSTAVIVVSASTEIATKIEALDLGACDYVSKPYEVSELLARLRVATRDLPRVPRVVVKQVWIGDALLDLECRRVTRKGKDVHLTPTEYRLLAFLASDPGRVMSVDEILSHVWGSAYKGEYPYVHTYIGRLRRKLEATPLRPTALLSDRGRGYRLELSQPLQSGAG